MNTAPTSAAHAFEALGDACELDLARARERLIAARAHQRVKDSTGNRARVAECRAQIDAILDLYLEARRTWWPATVFPGRAPLVA
jgi:hypothetical protein